MNQTRVNQLADRIRVLVAELLERRVKDPRLGFVTVTGVQLTPDLRDATVYYTVMGDDHEHSASRAALESATGMIRTEVGHQLGLRHAPSIRFQPDTVPETAARIDDLVRRARESDAQLEERAATATYAGDPDPYREPRDDDPEERA